ncbi:MAG: Asp-tRNA(Asn)/Glu-tRNA(Gln) amidotransferase subunit GatC [Defluviitaleaceae bacterium]|nr:Asp-tRNA(Asn)/Glu-tRNA(Gln) amidotransferase subunit GatC [Defluviitaleaceae bacterium]
MMRIEDYADMAKIALTEDEKKSFSAQVNILTESFDILKSIDTESVKALVTVLDIKNVFRDDVAAKTVPRETLLANAPEQYGGYFQVPKTL